MRSALLCLVLVVACKEKNPNYCPDQPDDLCVQVDAQEKCSATKPCTSGVCDEPRGVCVECLSNADCTSASAAICDTTAKMCGPCTKHTDCVDSEVCQDNGMCATKEQVLYVQDSGSSDANDCTFAARCASVSRALAVTPATRSIIKIKGTISEGNTVLVNNRNITIHADPMATLTRAGQNEILRIDGSSVVSMFDLQLSGATGNGGTAISILNSSSGAIVLRRLKLMTNSQLGLQAMGSGALEVSQSTFFDNKGGGIAIGGAHVFNIASNFITYNGSGTGTTSLIGGAQILANTPGSKVEFNTIAFNQSSGLSYRGGLQCNAPMVSAGGNIIYRNFESDGGGGLKSDTTTQNNTGGGTCVYGNTLVSVQDTEHLGFMSAVSMPYNFHLKPTAPATVVNAGGTCSIRDVDNEARPMGGACDLGADELKQ